MLKKISTFLSILIILTSSSQIPASAAVRPGSACKSLGAISEYSGKVFTCNKSGKKLTWSKGENIDTGWYAWSFRLNKKGVLERKGSSDEKWSSFAERPGQVIDPIRLRAFKEIQKHIANQSTKDETPLIRYSPNVNSEVKKVINYYFSQSLNFFQNVIPTGAKLETIISTEKDDDFLKSNILQIENNSQYGFDTYERTKTYSDQFRNGNPLNSSGGGGVGSTSMPGIYLYVGAVCSCFKAENVLMYNIAHEVTHYFQSANTPSIRKQNFQTINGELKELTVYIPLNLMEGSANTLGSALILKHPGWYSDQMDWHIGRLKSRGFLSEIRDKEETVRLLLAGDSWLRKKDEDPEISYILGQLQYEYYISRYGVPAFFALFKNIEKLGSYDAAIVETIGKSKSEFYSESADYVMKAFNKVGR